MPDPRVPAPGTITVYATSWCPFCTALLAHCERSGVSADVVDVDADPAAAAWVESVNAGNRIVPTVVYSDGSVETNPAPAMAVARA